MDTLNQRINAIIMTSLREGMRIEDILAVLSAQDQSLRNALPIVKAIQDGEKNPC